MKRSGLIAMLALTVLPLVLTGLAVLFVLPDTIPMHIGPHGVDRIGSKYDAFEIAFIVTGCGVLFTLMYAFMDKLAALGAVHGTDAQGGRTLMIFALALVNAIFVLVFACMVYGAQ